MNSRTLGLNYLEQTAKQQLQKSLLSLHLLLDKPAGIGDHSTQDFYDNLEEAFNQYADAQDKLEHLAELERVLEDHEE